MKRICATNPFIKENDFVMLGTTVKLSLLGSVGALVCDTGEQALRTCRQFVERSGVSVSITYQTTPQHTAGALGSFLMKVVHAIPVFALISC